MTSPRKTIGIIGGAISGPVFALQILSHPLLRQRYKPVIYEQLDPPLSAQDVYDANSNQGTKSVIHTAGASLGIFPNGLFPLFELGLRDALDEIGSQMEEIQVWRGDFRGTHALYNTMKNQNWDEELKSSVQTFERRRLRDMLTSRVEEFGGKIVWHKKVESITATEQSQPRIFFEDGEAVDVDLLVGADGSWSPVRKFILQARNAKTASERWPATFSGISGIYGVSSGPEIAKAIGINGKFKSQLVMLDRSNIGGLALKDGKIGWTLHMTEKSAPERVKSSASNDAVDEDTLESKMVPSVYAPKYTADILRSHQDIYHPDYGTWKQIFESSERIIHSPLRLQVWEANEIQWGNIALIGDAAHVLPPYTGQGSSFGIEDATVLADSLLNNPPPQGDDASFGAALTEYAERRVPRSKKLLPLASWSAASMAPGRFTRWIRDLLLRLPVRDPKVSKPSFLEPTMNWLFGERCRVQLRGERRHLYDIDHDSSTVAEKESSH